MTILDLEHSEEADIDVGKYGRMWIKYIKEEYPMRYKSLVRFGELEERADEVEEYIGHAPGGVCPFGIKDGIKVYLDESLKRFETVYPAAGNDHSAVRLTIAELEDVAGACGWIDVCKEILL